MCPICTHSFIKSLNMFLALLSNLMQSTCPVSDNLMYPTDYGLNVENNEHFDFIIIGAGSAGATIAHRLSENPNWNILLIEAGGYPSNLSEVLPKTTVQKTEVDWAYTTELGDYCLGYDDKKCNWPRGKGLGGSSSINAMLYVRSNELDHQEWIKHGANGWDWETVEKYYVKLDSDLDPVNGRIVKSNDIFEHPIRDRFIEAGKEIRLNYLYDVPTTTLNGTRFSTAKAYLRSIPPNLRVLMNATVTKILIDDGKANGVEMALNERTYKLYADKEVILSAGAINSPQILMLSGVGNEEDLEQLGINVKQNLPGVGQNLQDHLILPLIFSLTNSSTYTDPKALEKFCKAREGALASQGMLTFMGFINTKIDSIYPNIQFHHIFQQKRDTIGLPLILHSIGLNYESVKQIINDNKKNDIVFAIPTLLKPKSRGNITLQSKNPFQYPLIYPQYFNQVEDENTFIEAIRFLQNLLTTKSMEGINIFDYSNGVCKEYNTDNYWRCILRHFATTIYHPVGTCAMGASNNPHAVTDDHLRVLGVDNLRVVDASVMPTIVSGNTNIPTIMIAERASDLIKNDWQ